LTFDIIDIFILKGKMTNAERNTINLKLIKDKNYDELIKFNRTYLFTLANKMGANDQDEVNDLMSCGMEAIWEAATKFDITLSPYFIKYASIYIKKHMYEHLSNNGRTVRLPVNVIREDRKTGNNSSTTVSWSKPNPHSKYEGGEDMIEQVPNQPEGSDYSALYQIIDQLPERDQDIIKMYFGMEPYIKQHYCREIGLKYGYSHEWVREKINNIVKRFKKYEELREI
jgi:RNA polymerase sigma factor (sigma-70 family)